MLKLLGALVSVHGSEKASANLIHLASQLMMKKNNEVGS